MFVNHHATLCCIAGPNRINVVSTRKGTCLRRRLRRYVTAEPGVSDARRFGRRDESTGLAHRRSSRPSFRAKAAREEIRKYSEHTGISQLTGSQTGQAHDL